MLLEHKNAIVYGGEDRSAARSPALSPARGHAFLVGCTLARVEAVAQVRRYAPGDGQYGTVYDIERKRVPAALELLRIYLPGTRVNELLD
jgi:hypothetical protein